MFRRLWKPEEIEQLKKLYPDTKTSLIAKEFKRPIYSVYGQATALGLKKSEAFKLSAESGRVKKGTTLGKNTMFKPGSTPKNKGKKIEEFMRPETIEKFKQHCFKKGVKPHNTKNDGDVVLRKDKNGYKYQYIRLSLRIWQLYHIYIWEQKNGPVPADHLITFKDGNQLNVTIENLECITKVDNMLRNSIHRLPPELIEIIQITKRINKKIKKLS